MERFSLAAHEVLDALHFVALMERCGSISAEDASAWTRGIAERAALFHVGDGLVN